MPILNRAGQRKSARPGFFFGAPDWVFSSPFSPQRIHRRLKLRICHAAEAGPILLALLGQLDDGVKVPKRRIAATLQIAGDRGEPGGH